MEVPAEGDPQADPLELARRFYPRLDDLGRFSQVTAVELPDTPRQLLAHEHHMTVTVEAHHGGPVDVEVLAVEESPTHYARSIRLVRRSDGRCVQFGIVRIRWEAVDDSVREEIEARRAPLGRILIEHNVLRAVKPLAFWRIEPGPALRDALGTAAEEVCFGRTAQISLEHQPAVEVLEIVP